MPGPSSAPSRGAGLNGISNLTVELSTAEQDKRGESLTQPKRASIWSSPIRRIIRIIRIAEIFARRAARVLKPGGTALFVTRQTDWYEEHLPALFAAVAVEPVGNYRIVRCLKQTNDAESKLELFVPRFCRCFRIRPVIFLSSCVEPGVGLDFVVADLVFHDRSRRIDQHPQRELGPDPFGVAELFQEGPAVDGEG